MSIFELQTSLFTTLADPYIAPMRLQKMSAKVGRMIGTDSEPWGYFECTLGIEIIEMRLTDLDRSDKVTRWQGVVCPVCPSRSTALRSDFSHHPAIVLGVEPMGRRGANEKSRSDRRHPTGWERMIRWLDDLKGHVSSSKEWTILNSVLCSVHLSTTLWFGKWCH